MRIYSSRGRRSNVSSTYHPPLRNRYFISHPWIPSSIANNYYHLERGLFEDKIQVDELPSIWNEKMKQYLGIVPRNDGEGVLQDTHWSGGAFGYFPTYRYFQSIYPYISISIYIYISQSLFLSIAIHQLIYSYIYLSVFVYLYQPVWEPSMRVNSIKQR